MFLRQSTASQEILLGPFVDSTDGNTAETALTIANTDINIFKEGATTLATKNSGGATHISGGYYYAVLDATDTNTVGQLEVHVKVSGALAVKREYQVVEEAIYDAVYAASANGMTATHKNWLGAIAGKTADTTTRAEINATTAGATYNETTDSLEALRDRGDAAWITGTVVVGQVPSGVGETTLRNYVGENKTWTIATVDENGTAVDLSALSLTITIEDEDGTTVQTIATGSITKTSTSISFTTSAASANAVITNTHKWACRNSSTSEVKLRGPYIVEYAAG